MLVMGDRRMLQSQYCWLRPHLGTRTGALCGTAQWQAPTQTEGHSSALQGAATRLEMAELWLS